MQFCPCQPQTGEGIKLDFESANVVRLTRLSGESGNPGLNLPMGSLGEDDDFKMLYLDQSKI